MELEDQPLTKTKTQVALGELGPAEISTQVARQDSMDLVYLRQALSSSFLAAKEALLSSEAEELEFLELEEEQALPVNLMVEVVAVVQTVETTDNRLVELVLQE